MQADWSDGDEEISRLLEALGSKQLPVVAVFPATDAHRPRKLTGFYTQAQLKRAIRDAMRATADAKSVASKSQTVR